MPSREAVRLWRLARVCTCIRVGRSGFKYIPPGGDGGGYLGVMDDAIRHQRVDLEFTLRDHLEQSIGTSEVGCLAEETCSGSADSCWAKSSR